MENLARDLDVRREEQGVKGAFYVLMAGRRVGELTYTSAGETTVILDHTEVGPELRGTGAGRKLVEAAIAWARSSGKRVLPLCPFARATIERNPELQDVLAR